MSKKIKLESKYCIGLDVPLILLNSDYYEPLRNEKVNLRQGPSFDYPIKIFYKKKIFACFDSR